MTLPKLAALAALVLALSSGPSLASFGLFCEGPDGVSASIPLGGGVGLTPLGAEIQAAGQIWTTEEGVSGTIEIAPGQSAQVGDQLYLDFADPNLEVVIAELRLFWAMENDEPVYGGTLRIPGQGAWPISCGAG
ncbi:MAG: hypothetical protein EOP22_12355 [Hyphomicrobiales bacterium]|nr:MAG: hypothetical protein EOP22_12355 [Hyphomicrobiales bacterium]